jgi:hypothetical protein
MNIKIFSFQPRTQPSVRETLPSGGYKSMQSFKGAPEGRATTTKTTDNQYRKITGCKY